MSMHDFIIIYALFNVPILLMYMATIIKNIFGKSVDKRKRV